jgi:hypothetical protein
MELRKAITVWTEAVVESRSAVANPEEKGYFNDCFA